jgi:hypothetical protein
LDNCGIINFINNKILLDKGFFVFCRNIFNVIEAGIFIFFIINRKKYIFKNILNDISGSNIEDLIFYNVYIIEGFYINIIFEIYLRTQGI